MLPSALAPLDPHKTRALTTIYAPRKLKPRKNKTAQTRMLENDTHIKPTLSPFHPDTHIKPTLSPFHPLPAIGQKLERSKTKVIVFDLNRDSDPVKLHDVLKPLTPLRIHGYRKKSLDLEVRRPQQLLRENTYDVIEPIYLNIKDKVTLKQETVPDEQIQESQSKVSPKTRFKKAAMQVAKLSSMPETGKLLCLRERQTYSLCREEDNICRLDNIPQTPEQKLNKLSEIFQNLEMKGRCRDRMKKENSWF
ncbi:Uncharacterized protein OBRU01_11460 [Operophtera brumata]|uniref:Uncharacterized protein n=1 Tax=Operophtera brumata TaxID=104452 RepID=A0A0L7LBQ6_OPEBR|nr:Uncharacterized protein OBRU01_11460 [Operophtera brumata]